MYVTSAEGRTGKSTVAVGLLAALADAGERVAVFRPVLRSAEGDDAMVAAMAERADAGIPAADGLGVPSALLRSDPDEALRRIVDTADDLGERADWLLVLGSDYTGVAAPTELADNARIAANLGAPVVLVVRGQTSDDAPREPSEIAEAATIALAELRHEHASVAAIVVNRADPGSLDDAVAAVAAVADGIPVRAIAEDRALTAPLLGALLDAVDAMPVTVTAVDRLRPVPTTVLAGMSVEHVLPKLAADALVIVPADRSDALLGVLVAHASATSPQLAGVLINGGVPIAPAVQGVIDGVHGAPPMATTDLDSYTTALRLSTTRSLLAADSPQKYRVAEELFARHVDAQDILDAVRAAPSPVMTPTRFEHLLAERARSRPMRIVLPEGNDDRILEAAAIVTRRGLARLTVLGDPDAIRARAAELGLDLDGVDLLSPHDAELGARFAEEYHRLRAHKGVTSENAAETVTDVSYFGTMMVHLGLADGMVSGARHTTAHTIRPAFEFVKTAPGVSVVSSVFLMALADRVLVYGDCAVIPEPTVEQLADIAVSAAATARRFGIDPRVAMLSYSTGESGSGGEVDQVRAATALVREREPGLPVAGPIQYDAAADPVVAAAKLPDSDVAGRATVFVFPDLDAGNSTYKAVQRSAGAVAIGPVLQGLAKPVNDLSRGALVRDIVNTIAITAIQAQGDDDAAPEEQA